MRNVRGEHRSPHITHTSHITFHAIHKGDTMLRKLFLAALAILSLATAADAAVQGQVIDQTARNTSAQTARDHKRLADAVGTQAQKWNQAAADVADLKNRSNTGLTEAQVEAIVMRLLHKHAVELNGPAHRILKADVAKALSQGTENTKQI